jgi:hypothetical protein
VGELWKWFPASCAPLAALSAQLGVDYPRMMEKLAARAQEKLGPGPLKLDMPAFLTMGTKS